MSKKQAIAFFEEISKNNQLAKEVEKVVDGKDSDEAKAKELLSLAKNHNFNFTQEDAQNAKEALKKPLSPEEMLEVSGGKLNLKSSLMAMALLAGLGVGGAALHNMEASAMKRTTPGYGKQGISDLTGPTQRQRTSRLVGPTNSAQNETPPSNGQATPQNATKHTSEPPNEKKIRANVEHDKKAAGRFGGITGCSGKFLETVRGLAGNGYLPNPAWPAVPQFELTGDGKHTCRYCTAKLTNGNDPFCKNPGCIFPWIFRTTSGKRQSLQRLVTADSCARWVLLPALILDSRNERINSTGKGRKGFARQLAIETPAEAWAVWQLIVGHHDGWVDVTTMLRTYGVDAATIERVKKLLEGSYGNLVKGNEHLRAIGLGSEVQQLVEDHNNGWQNFIGAMVERGYGSEEVKKAVTKMINSYYMLNENQPRASGYTPSPAALDEIEAAHQRFEGAMQQAKARQQAEEARRQEARRQEEARRQAREEARRQATWVQTIEKLQSSEKLSIEDAKAIAPTLKCDTCGNTGAKVQNTKGHIYFYCKSCKAKISNKPADLLAMLQVAAPGNMPRGMANAEQDEPQMQIEIQPMQMNQGEGPTVALSFNPLATPQIGTQGMNQFNHGQQMMTYNHDDLENTFIEPYQLQTGDPNDFTFNMGRSHAPIHHHLTVYQMDGPQQPVNAQMQNMDQMNGQQQNTQFAQNQQIMAYQPGVNFDPSQELQQPAAQQNGTQLQQNLNPQPTLNLDLHHDPVGDYVNALNTNTQELAQYTGMLLELINTGQAANVAQIVEVEIAAQTVVNRVFARELQEPANQIILNTLSADNRYLGAAQAFSDQFEIFNNVLDMIGKQWK